ncbi:MAG: hypothetical protein AAFO87_06630 [Cyanobacteria bacterium J06607_6]
MDHIPQDKRHQATRKFVKALDELETVLQITPANAPESPSQQSAAAEPPAFEEDAVDLGQLLDDAVQDIERFMSSEDSPTA